MNNKKQTIKEKVIANSELLNSYTTSQELRTWALMNGLDSAAGFSSFKKALIEIGIDYDMWKRNGKPTGAITIITENEVNFIEVEKSPLELIANEIGGRLWIKGDKRRIYTEGGNNYHYDGKWHIEFDEDGDFEAKVWLNDGFNNKKSESYREKYLRQMENQVIEAMEILGIQKENLALFELPEYKQERLEREQLIKNETDRKCQAVRESLTQESIEPKRELQLSDNDETPWE